MTKWVQIEKSKTTVKAVPMLVTAIAAATVAAKLSIKRDEARAQTLLKILERKSV